ncbi:MAG: ribonuclease H-like domain-containing protein [Candidatus Hadarchaeales archaeon]
MPLYLDIETSSKTADEGSVVALGILRGEKPHVRFCADEGEERAALEELARELEGCDLVVTWYGSGFDLPFLKARAILLGVDLRRLLLLPSLDLYLWCKRHLLLSSYRLDSVARFFGLSRKVEFEGKDVSTLFRLALRGDQTSKELILQHCAEDLELLREVHRRMERWVEHGGQAGGAERA